jgi:hypothetical protein
VTLRAKRCTLILFAALSAVAAGCGDDNEETTKPKPAKPSVRSFVGELRGTDALVAVVVPRSGQTQAYVCNGRKLIEFFSGRSADDKLRLDSEDGDTKLAADVGSGAATGTVTLASGKTRRFEAASVDAPAGLYTGTLTSAGVLRATAASRGKLEARVNAEGGVTGNITSANGEASRVNLGRAADRKPGPFRLIYAQNGTAKGGKRSLGFIVKEVEN